MVLFDFTLLRLQIPHQQLQKRRFADTVRPHNGHTTAHVDTEVHAYEKRFLGGVRKRHILKQQKQ